MFALTNWMFNPLKVSINHWVFCLFAWIVSMFELSSSTFWLFFCLNLNVEAKVEDSSNCRGGVILHINIRSLKRINFTFKISECEEMFQIVTPSSDRSWAWDEPSSAIIPSYSNVESYDIHLLLREKKRVTLMFRASLKLVSTVKVSSIKV